MGFEVDHTKLVLENGKEIGKGARLKMLGNSFSIPVIAYLLAPLTWDCFEREKRLIQITLSQKFIGESKLNK
jgi:hypothetical protein